MNKAYKKPYNDLKKSVEALYKVSSIKPLATEEKKLWDEVLKNLQEPTFAKVPEKTV